ncbi:MAG: hypothetical protein RL514_3674 [Verrucomicrobiota bacterium]|jgi:hypothetical protein
MIFSTSTVVRAPELISGTLDEQAVLLSIENGEYYQMNRMATRVWAAVEQPCRVSELVTQLQSEFEVDPAVCEREVLAFLTQLHTDKLLHIQTVTA